MITPAGILVGMLFTGLMWFADRQIYSKILRNKAHPNGRTAEKIGNSFYYIVPEDEYVTMMIIDAGRAALGEGMEG